MKYIKRMLLIITVFMFNAYRIFADTFDMSPYTLKDKGFGSIGDNCAKIAGPNIIKVIKGSINTVRIAGVIIAIANAMIILIPAVIGKDADALKKAEKKLITLFVVLAAIGIFPSIVSIISNIFDFDLSCLV